MKKQGLILILGFLLTGCLPAFKRITNEAELTKHDFKLLEGEYRNLSINAPRQVSTHIERPYNAWENINDMHISIFDTIKRHIPERQTITIQMESHKRMHVFLKQDDKIILQKTLKGRWRSGAFQAKIEFLLIPSFPIFFLYRHEKCRIGKTTEGDLVVGNTFYAVCIMLMAAGNKQSVTNVHKRVNP